MESLGFSKKMGKLYKCLLSGFEFVHYLYIRAEHFLNFTECQILILSKKKQKKIQICIL